MQIMNSIDNAPFFSVIIPLYNKKPHILQTIDSVLNQTFRDFEIIVVDDASTDGSYEIVKEKITGDKIKLFKRKQPSTGGYAARNYGIEKSSGKWIAFIDADDEWYPIHLEKMYQLTIKYPHIMFLASGWEYSNSKISINAYYRAYSLKGPHEITLLQYLDNCIKKRSPVWTSVACVKNDNKIVKNLFEVNRNSGRGGDIFAWLKIMCFCREMAWSPHIGAIYRQDSVNMVTKKTNLTFFFMGNDKYDRLSVDLSKKEKKHLRKFLNRWIFSVWVQNIIKSGNTIRILSIKKVYWKDDCAYALFIKFFSLFPAYLWFVIYKFLKRMRNIIY